MYTPKPMSSTLSISDMPSLLTMQICQKLNHDRQGNWRSLAEVCELSSNLVQQIEFQAPRDPAKQVLLYLGGLNKKVAYLLTKLYAISADECVQLIQAALVHPFPLEGMSRVLSSVAAAPPPPPSYQTAVDPRSSLEDSFEKEIQRLGEKERQMEITLATFEEMDQKHQKFIDSLQQTNLELHRELMGKDNLIQELQTVIRDLQTRLTSATPLPSSSSPPPLPSAVTLRGVATTAGLPFPLRQRICMNLNSTQQISYWIHLAGRIQERHRLLNDGVLSNEEIEGIRQQVNPCSSLLLYIESRQLVESQVDVFIDCLRQIRRLDIVSMILNTTR